MSRDTALPLPEMVEIEPTNFCNLRCKMCHSSYMPEGRTEFLDPEMLKNLSCLKGAYISVSSGYEPLVHPEFPYLIKTLGGLAGRLQLITNAVNLSGDNLDALVSAAPYLLNISFDGVTKTTYERIRRGASYERTLKNISEAVRLLHPLKTIVAVNYTMMRSNLDEIVQAVDFWSERDIDMLRFLVMVTRFPEPELLRESIYPVRSLAAAKVEEAVARVRDNSLRMALEVCFKFASGGKPGPVFHSGAPGVRHCVSYRQEYLLGDDPRMRFFKCRGPFNTANILPNGDVQMCYKFSVGNLRDRTFEEIWRGAEAEAAREKVMASAEHCGTCNCYKFGVNYDQLDLDDMSIHFSTRLHSYMDKIDFSNFTIDAPKTFWEPVLVESCGPHNIIRYDGNYIAVLKSLGAVDLKNTDYKKLPGVLIAGSYSQIKEKIIDAPKTFWEPVLVDSCGEHNIVRYGGNYVAVLQSLGTVDWENTDYKKLPGVLIADSYSQIKEKIRALGGHHADR